MAVKLKYMPVVELLTLLSHQTMLNVCNVKLKLINLFSVVQSSVSVADIYLSIVSFIVIVDPKQLFCKVHSSHVIKDLTAEGLNSYELI